MSLTIAASYAFTPSESGSGLNIFSHSSFVIKYGGDFTIGLLIYSLDAVHPELQVLYLRIHLLGVR